MRIEPESAFSRPMTSLSNTLLPVPLRPSTARVCPRPTLKLTPLKTARDSKDLCTSSTATASAGACCWGLAALILTSSAMGMGDSQIEEQGLLKEDEDQFHEHHVCQDDEKGGQNHGVGGRAAYSLSASRGAHSLETGDDTGNEAENSGLESGGEEVVEGCAVKAGVDEQTKRE